jgi:hypothetical protein
MLLHIERDLSYVKRDLHKIPTNTCIPAQSRGAPQAGTAGAFVLVDLFAGSIMTYDRALFIYPYRPLRTQAAAGVLVSILL